MTGAVHPQQVRLIYKPEKLPKLAWSTQGSGILLPLSALKKGWVTPQQVDEYVLGETITMGLTAFAQSAEIKEIRLVVNNTERNEITYPTLTAEPDYGGYLFPSQEFGARTGQGSLDANIQRLDRWKYDGTMPDYNIYFTPSDLGIYNIEAMLIDHTGYSTTTSSYRVRVHNGEPPVIELVTPRTGESFALDYDRNQDIRLVAKAQDPDWQARFGGDQQLDRRNELSRVWFYADDQFVGVGNRILGTDLYQFVWRPTVAGTYRITAIAVDDQVGDVNNDFGDIGRVGGTGTSDPQYVTITNRSGSRPPDVHMVHPSIPQIYPGYTDPGTIPSQPAPNDDRNLQPDYDPQYLANEQRLAVEYPNLYTSGSRDMVWAWADDRDGDLKSLQFYVNGANAVIQLRENPQSGDSVFIKSGATNLSIPFGNGSTEVAIGSDSIETAKNLKNFLFALQSLGFNSFLMPGAATDYEKSTVLINFNDSKNAELSSSNEERIFPWLFKELSSEIGSYSVRTGHPQGQVLNGFGGTYFAHPFVPGLNGIFSIYAVVKDTSENRVMSIPSYYKSTTGEPDANGTLQLPAIVANNQQKLPFGSTLTVRSTAESLYPIEYVEFFDNGRLFDTPPSYVDENGTFHRGRRVEFDSPYYVAEWNATELGEHILYSRFTDIRGNSFLSDQHKLFVTNEILKPIITTPLTEDAKLLAGPVSEGKISTISILDGGYGYRSPPQIIIEGGGGSGAEAVASIKNGVAQSISVISSGYGYDSTKATLRILDNGVEHSGESNAQLQPVFDSAGGISSINILSGGSDYYPTTNTLYVELLYNGSISGTGFKAGPIYTVQGVISGVSVLNSGVDYVVPPQVRVDGQSKEYAEGEPVRISVIHQSSEGIVDVKLWANGVEQNARPAGIGERGEGRVDVIRREPYFDIFWIPDTDDDRLGIGNTQGLGTWEFYLELVDAKGKIETTDIVEIKVVQSKPPTVEITSPEPGSVFVFDPTNPITLVADALDPDGIVTEVQYFINNKNTDFNGTANYTSLFPPYLMEWRAPAIGEYTITAMAVDNSGQISLSLPRDIIVREPIGEKPIVNWVFPSSVKRSNSTSNLGFSSYYYYYYGFPTGGNNYVDYDYSLGSTIPLNIKASDDGTITKVEFFVNNEFVGVAEDRYLDIYSFDWIAQEQAQALVYATVTDDQNNTVRTDVKEFNFGTNLGRNPTIEASYLRKSSRGSHEIRVILRNIADPANPFDFDGSLKQENRNDFDLELLVNGARIAGVGTRAYLQGRGTTFQPLSQNEPGSYFYDFTNIVFEEAGYLEVGAALSSRQGRDNYRQALISNTIEVYIAEDEIDDGYTGTIPPIGEVISPRSKNFARAVSTLERDALSDRITGRVESIKMTNIGSGYDKNDPPQVVFYGGGGKGATASLEIKDGAIGKLNILEGGKNYQNGDKIYTTNAISGIGFDAIVEVVDGVLLDVQSISNGAIVNSGQGYDRDSIVKIIDISTGSGAKGYISKFTNLEEDGVSGGVKEITLTSLGQSYNLSTAYIQIESSTGYGFQSGPLAIKNGVIIDYEIINSGEGYATDSSGSINLLATSLNGSGFVGSAPKDYVENGALSIAIDQKGYGYNAPPIIMLQGGRFLPSISGRKKPLQVTQGTKVTLLADAEDFDGRVQSVRFYGNGKDLGIQFIRVFTDIALENPGNGYTSPPTISIVGGGGNGATAVASLVPPTPNAQGGPGNPNEPRALGRITLTSSGSGYTTAPDIIIQGGNGNGARGRAIVTDQEIITESYQLIQESKRWGLNWIPSAPGTYIISLEVTDFDGAVSFIESTSDIIVLPRITSKVPEIVLFSDVDGQAFTSKSTLRFAARAQDPDGKLEGVQFYINGELLGEEILSNYGAEQLQQPYSVEFSPKDFNEENNSSVYTVFAVARDNSGNHVMSDSVSFTTTLGSGDAPVVRLVQPTTAAEGFVNVASDGSIDSITLTNRGSGYAEPPKVSILGKGDNANFLSSVDLSPNSPTFGQLKPIFDKLNSGSGFKPESSKVEFIGGFKKLSTSGKLAQAEVRRNQRSVILNNVITVQYSYSIDSLSLDGGEGYTSVPRVVFSNGPPGMAGIATIDPLKGTVTSVTITNQGRDNTTPYTPLISFVGGLTYSEILLEAFADDGSGSIQEVAFYQNGVLISDEDSLDSNPDSRAPYQILWSPEGPGIYELYATAKDSDGNINTSPLIQREAILSEAPIIEFNPISRAFGYVLPSSIDENGTITALDQDGQLPTSSLLYQGEGYTSHPQVEFLDNRELSNGGVALAQGQAVLENGKITGIRLLKDSLGGFIGGTNYPKYKRLSGSVKISNNSDLLVGLGTNFIDEVDLGQPMMLGFLDSASPIEGLPIFTAKSMQSLNELILESPFLFDGVISPDQEFSLFTYGTKIVLSGGMNTSSKPIVLRNGEEVSLGMRVVDPEGKAIRSDSFIAYVNGQENETVTIQGTGPFYRILWTPPDLGSYSLRIQVADIDGARGVSQSLDIRVSAGYPPMVKMISPIAENDLYIDEVKQNTFAFGTTLNFTFEAKDFDGTIEKVEFFANSIPIGVWPQINPSTGGAYLDNNSTGATRREGSTNRYTVSWKSSYPGTFSITASATDNSNIESFAAKHDFIIKAPYKNGSLPPSTTIVYPKENRQAGDIDPDGYPVFKTHAFTSASTIPLITRAFDQDGALEGTKYFVDGHFVPYYSGYLQIIDTLNDGDTFTLDDGLGVKIQFEFDDNNQTNPDNVRIPLVEKISDLVELRTSFDLYQNNLLSSEMIDRTIKILSKYGVKRIEIPSINLFESLLNGIKEDSIDEQRVVTKDIIKNHSSNIVTFDNKLKIDPQIIGFNGIFLKHEFPHLLVGLPLPKIEVFSLNQSLLKKGFVEGLLRFPSRDSENYHFTQLWSPPTAGVYTIFSTSMDTSGNITMSSPISLTSTVGTRPPHINLTSPQSGVQRSVSLVGEHAQGIAVNSLDYYTSLADGTTTTTTFFSASSRYWIGYLRSVRLTNRGSGYITPPSVEFVGSGFGAKATASIYEDESHPRFGQIREIVITDEGQGYFGTTLVEFRGGLGNEDIFLNASAGDSDGEVDNVSFLVNGREITKDLTQPYSTRDEFSVGYYEFIATARDDAGNITTSKPVTLNISTIRGSAPSGFMIYPLPPLALGRYESEGQNYFWGFVEEYSELIRQQEATLGNQEESFSVSANSYIHLTTRASDSDGEIKEVSFFLNNKLLGFAERQNNSQHYSLAVDLSDFGEQPVYRVDTKIKDNAGNVVIPNNPIFLDVIAATGSRPEVEIISPTPKLFPVPTFSMGGRVTVSIDVKPKEGTIKEVSLYANGRFIGNADLNNSFPFGTKRFSLPWIAENPGYFTLTASVRDDLGTVVFTNIGSDIIIADSEGSLPPEVNLVYPNPQNQNMVLTSTSTIRLELNATDPDGGLSKVQYFVNGKPYGDPIYANNTISQNRITYGVNWTPGAPGNFIIYAVATDNSGNQVMSDGAVLTSTTGDSNVPIVKASSLDSSYYIGEEIIYSVDVSDEAFSYYNESSVNGYVEEVTFFVNGEQTSVDDSKPYYGSWTPIEEGQYEIYAQARDNQGNIGISNIQTVTVESEILRLEMFLNAESSFYDGTPFTLDLTLYGKSEDLDDLLNQRVPSTLKLYVNGAFFNENVSGTPTQVYNNNGDLVSLGYKLNYTTSYADHADYNGQVSLTGILSDPLNITAVSNVILIEIIPPTPWVNPDSNLLNLRKDLLGGSNISLSEIEEAIRAVENGEGIKWLVSLTEKDAFKNRLDLLTANRIVNGTHFSKYSDFQEDISTYITNVDLLPGTPALGSIAWLKSYIDYSLQKENYISSFGEVPYLVGDWQLRQIYKFSDSRRNFVNEIFTKKYGRVATFSQRIQGAARLLDFWLRNEPNYWESTNDDDGIVSLGRRDNIGPNNFNAGELAVELIWQLSTENALEGGLSYILGSENLRSSHYVPAVLSALILKESWNGMRIDKKKQLIGMTVEQALTTITKDPEYIRGYNLIWRNSELLSSQVPYWKRERWFGTFNDKQFPWIYHTKLGWLYCAANIFRDIWFYSTLQLSDKELKFSNSSPLGWIWTSDRFFPWVYSYSKNDWIYFDTATTPVRVYSSRSAEWTILKQ